MTLLQLDREIGRLQRLIEGQRRQAELAEHNIKVLVAEVERLEWLQRQAAAHHEC